MRWICYVFPQLRYVKYIMQIRQVRWQDDLISYNVNPPQYLIWPNKPRSQLPWFDSLFNTCRRYHSEEYMIPGLDSKGRLLLSAYDFCLLWVALILPWIALTFSKVCCRNSGPNTKDSPSWFQHSGVCIVAHIKLHMTPCLYWSDRCCCKWIPPMETSHSNFPCDPAHKLLRDSLMTGSSTLTAHQSVRDMQNSSLVGSPTLPVETTKNEMSISSLCLILC